MSNARPFKRGMQRTDRQAKDKARRQLVKEGYRQIMVPPDCDAIILPPAAVKDVDEMVKGGLAENRQALYQHILFIGFKFAARELGKRKVIVVPEGSVATQILEKTDTQRKRGELV